jgi:glutaredoxin 3
VPPGDGSGGVPTPDALDADVVVYATDYCGYCRRAKELLQRRGIEFEAIDVTGNADARAWMVAATGRRTVPQVFIKGRSIGGYTELAAMDRSGALARALAS